MVDIGKRIKQLREERGLTLKNIADNTGLSVGFLSQVERNITDPSIASLKKIAEVLGIKLKEFFEKVPEKKVVVRKDERNKLLIGSSKIVYELLAPAMNRKMEPILKMVEPNASSGEVDGHEGEEFAIILQGVLEVCIGNEVYVLQEGDSIYFDANQPHLYRNPGTEKCICIWVVTPPTFS
ncbi:MAG: Transcriptional regulator [Peptococcaceae bacterium]|jgi:transcriptional regulator with XRE-family HTH domain|uniref:Cupin domain-containing protein n=1 Tax=Thermanaerosceptrum fracticalcis TaxID=1712410 RepID=A0A7G6E2P2_THEFR|nr:XRE family transcriptional regulator [Thermanaerosceptrum fracticalcis]MBZ4653919.1 Transcriptional regulator [Peptococcaceae bacterium]QNB46346.1 cupin domain-containing protein [Thermanaerosceptrum fracticalcis]